MAARSASAESRYSGELGGNPDPTPALAARLDGAARRCLDWGSRSIRGAIRAPWRSSGKPSAEALPAVGSRVGAAAAAAFELSGEHPNVDFALGAAATTLGLPPGAALGIFLVARSVGWIAHAIEQYESGMLIRPRARYTGKRPPPQLGAASAA